MQWQEDELVSEVFECVPHIVELWDESNSARHYFITDGGSKGDSLYYILLFLALWFDYELSKLHLQHCLGDSQG